MTVDIPGEVIMTIQPEINLNDEIEYPTRKAIKELSRNKLAHLGYCRLLRKTPNGDIEYGKISILDIFHENYTVVDPKSFQTWHYDSIEELLEDGWVEKL